MPKSLTRVIWCVLVIFLGSQSQAFGVESGNSQSDQEVIPLAKKRRKKAKSLKFDDDYRYDWDDRHLTLGIDFGGGFPSGSSFNAFPYGGTVTPYFKGAFGDGNSIQLDITVGYEAHSGGRAEWLYFRTPIMDGSLSWGYLAFLAPNIQFRYELDLGSSIRGKSPLLFWGGIGLGSMITYGEAELTDNGELEDHSITNLEVFFDFVPTFGLKLRLGEFGYFELGTRFHLLYPLGTRLTDEDEITWGKPVVLEEFYISRCRVIDVGIGFSYDFM